MIELHVAHKHRAPRLVGRAEKQDADCEIRDRCDGVITGRKDL